MNWRLILQTATEAALWNSHFVICSFNKSPSSSAYYPFKKTYLFNSSLKRQNIFPFNTHIFNWYQHLIEAQKNMSTTKQTSIVLLYGSFFQLRINLVHNETSTTYRMNRHIIWYKRWLCQQDESYNFSDPLTLYTPTWCWDFVFLMMFIDLSISIWWISLDRCFARRMNPNILFRPWNVHVAPAAGQIV